MAEKKIHTEQKLTLVIDTIPAMCSWVLAQTLVLLSSDVTSPLQDRDVSLKYSTKFSIRDLTSDTVGAGLWKADNTAMLQSNYIQEVLSHHKTHMIITKPGSLVTLGK